MEATARAGTQVRHYRQVLLWPLALMPDERPGHARPWEKLGADPRWHEIEDELAGGASQLTERHYSEFVTFLPYVQRFLYGEGRRQPGRDEPGDPGSPMRVFRRDDIAQAQAVLRAGEPPIALGVKHVDLYFFYDLDVVLLNVELVTDGITLAQAQELMYRLGRGYPGGWQPDGEPLHCLHDLQWLDAQGQVLARSDAAEREAFLGFVAQHRAPRIAAHWAYLLSPLVADHSPAAGPLRFRQIEYYRMPTMAYLAVDDPQALTRADYVRLGLVTGSEGSDETLPFAHGQLGDFETRHCSDRFFTPGGAAPYTRYLCCGQALVVVGPAHSAFFRCPERGVLAQFRHQHFLLFLIAHVQKAALLMFSDRLVDALKRLDVRDAESVRHFKRRIRAVFEGFLRFTHRYWFHDISEQAQVKALFATTAQQLDLERLYPEVKQRIADMSAYLDADSLRRQANTVVRLTVVTIFGLIGTITTGFFGMNLIAASHEPFGRRVLGLTLVFIAVAVLTLFTIVKSKRLSDFLDALSDERLSPWSKCRAFVAVFLTPRGPGG